MALLYHALVYISTRFQWFLQQMSNYQLSKGLQQSVLPGDDENETPDYSF